MMNVDSSNELGEGLWARFRNVLIALDRIDRLETASDFVGWVENFQTDPVQIELTTRDWILRALHRASDPTNYQLLIALTKRDGLSIAELMHTTNLTRVDLTERIKDLAQSGFVAQALESEIVQGTLAATGLVALVESLREQIAERTRAGLMKDNPAPKFHRPKI